MREDISFFRLRSGGLREGSGSLSAADFLSVLLSGTQTVSVSAFNRTIISPAKLYVNIYCGIRALPPAAQ